MKAFYKCERCGKIYESEKEALECEVADEKREIEKKKKAENKSARVKEIEKLIEKYIEDYNELPKIDAKIKLDEGLTAWRFRIM